MLQRRFNHFTVTHQSSLLWLVIAQLVAVLAHFSIIPVWLTAFVVGLVVLRYLMSAGRISELSKLSKIGVMLLMTAVFIVSSGLQFTVEVAVAFFVLAYSLKTLELKLVRDAYIFGFLTIFLLTLSLLFSQSLLLSLYVFVALGICFLSLMAINTSLPTGNTNLSTGNTNLSTGLSTSKLCRVYGMMLLAIPLLILFYIVFPRFGPLWSMPMKSSTAFTGLGDTVAPGDVANLAQSDKRAFRAAFANEPPPLQRLYWRSLILDRYDGLAWSRSINQINRDEGRTRQASASSPWEYEVTVDPHNREWAFALQNAAAVDGNIYQTPDHLVRFTTQLKTPASYQLATLPASQAKLTERLQQRYLKVPAGMNPRSNAIVDNLTERYNRAEDRINALLAYFHQNEYFYTLNPPLLTSNHRVDEFLFDSQRGFCEHYASSMAYLLRKMNIPARVVAGYQGGEWNSQGEFLVVHQYDAHAWVEAWIEGVGWVEYDPTSAVAPSRIESGIREALAGEGSFLESSPLSLVRYSHIGAVNWLRGQLEVLNYEWVRLVVNYDRERQRSLFSKLLGQDSLVRLAALTILLVVLFFTGLGLAALLPEWRRRREKPIHYLFETLISKLRKIYPTVHSGMTPQQLLSVIDSSSPSQQALQDIVYTLEYTLYSGQQPQAHHLRSLRAKIKHFRVV